MLAIKSGAIAGFTAAADTAGNDIYLATQTAGADAGANPRGGDFILTLGAGDGTGRDGLFDVQGRSNFENGAYFGGAELIIGASNVLHLGASGGTPVTATASGDVYCKQKFECLGNVDLNGTLDVASTSTFTAYINFQNTLNRESFIIKPGGNQYGAFGYYEDDSIRIMLNATDGRCNRNLVICDGSHYNQDFNKTTLATDPTVYLSSSTAFTTRDTEYAKWVWNEQSLGSYGSRFGMKFMEEEVTIAIGEGNTPIVVSSTNLAPVGSAIFAVSFYVTQAPGGGATTLSIGITGGDADEFVQTASCDLVTESALSILGSAGDGTITGLKANAGAATTFDLTTDADVTGTDMKVRVTIAYFDFSAASA